VEGVIPEIINNFSPGPIMGGRNVDKFFFGSVRCGGTGGFIDVNGKSVK
jgi:hypothetical protein